MSVFSDSAFDNHERVDFCFDEATGLRSIIAIHSTALGPGAGGCRMWAYEDDAAALHDVLRLSQGMSYKNAMAGLPLGGGKAVIIKSSDQTDDAFERFGDFVDSLNGQYVTAEDMGMSEQIMQTIARRTKYVTGLPAEGGGAGGDPSPKTALGIFTGIKAAAAATFGDDDLSGKTVAIQGVGNVGNNLCALLKRAGAKLLVSDLDASRVDRAVSEFGAVACDTDELLFQEVDILAPCAMGAVFSEESIPAIKAPVIAGGANNQLKVPEDGQRLLDAGILYAPDYVINAGGIINVSCEYAGGFTEADVEEKVLEIGPRLSRLFEISKSEGRPTNELADEEAQRLIGRG